ncbi:MAG: nitroreductase family protein [Spirochaetaceae bacterium]|jgi:nitroreductase|nr:nitroreductase family protein [Spirochaetaceae bacterium]
MTLFEAIQKRYSYRGTYQPVPVPRGDLQKIMEAGLAAPSGCNTQTTSLIGLDDPGLIKIVGGLLEKSGFSTAPAALCVLTQHIPGYDDVYFNVQDYAAAIENCLLAITALGYASCWVEGQVTGNPGVQQKIAQALGVPEEYTVVAYLPVGLPEREGKRPAYKAFAERAWFNGFGRP